MAKSVSELQDGMRFKGADDSIVITEGEGLQNLNNIYRKQASVLPWQELLREDTSILTTSAVRNTWPLEPVFLDVKLVEIQDGDDGDDYKPIFPAPDYNSLSESRRKAKQGVPDYYLRLSTANEQQIEFAPGPKYSGKTVRRLGVIEPVELEGASSYTVFLPRIADDALEWMLAGMYLERDGFIPQAQVRYGRAQEIFEQLFGKELVPDELVRRIVPPP
jgi:hypothetical protein